MERNYATVTFLVAVVVANYSVLLFILIIISIPSPLAHSFIPGLKPYFSANPSHRNFLLQDWLYVDSPDCLLLLLSISVVDSWIRTRGVIRKSKRRNQKMRLSWADGCQTTISPPTTQPSRNLSRSTAVARVADRRRIYSGFVLAAANCWPLCTAVGPRFLNTVGPTCIMSDCFQSLGVC